MVLGDGGVVHGVHLVMKQVMMASVVVGVNGVVDGRSSKFWAMEDLVGCRSATQTQAVLGRPNGQCNARMHGKQGGQDGSIKFTLTLLESSMWRRRGSVDGGVALRWGSGHVGYVQAMRK